jgi:NADH-quinone oxidoreductase subunit L
VTSILFIVFLPLLAAIVAGFSNKTFGAVLPKIVTTGALFISAFLSWTVFIPYLSGGEATVTPVLDWIHSGDMRIDWALRVDALTAVMLVVITSVSALVHLYSWGYMDEDPDQPRFFAYLSLFTFAMLMLVTADNLVQMFFGWEGVGLASYLLIGFWFRKPSANAAAIKAFVVNRVGDLGFMLGIFGTYLVFHTISIPEILRLAPGMAGSTIGFVGYRIDTMTLLCLLLFVGAMGKSAQLGLHTWLPDAMEGPTPVSALIHAATMVTAGVFLVCRMSPVYEYAPSATAFITVLGALTAFVAATIGLVQNDIKRVIAYSTMSQLGYMFVAAGLGAYPVAMFHLFTHAFFKAMLFLGAGSVIHATHHEQDMRNYGGLRKKIPLTFWAMMIGTLAITGVGIPLTYYGFAGFLSKDAVIETAYVGSSFAFWLLVVAACFTSFYSWRLMFMTFYGTSRAKAHDGHAHEPHESPMIMLIPLGALALGAMFSGMVWYKVYFGDEVKVRDWFGMESAAHSQAHGDDHATTTEALAEGEAVAEVAAEADATHGDAAHAAGTVPKGALVMLPFTADEQALVDARLDPKKMEKAEHAPTTIINAAHLVPAWVKVSPFVAMLIGLFTAWLFYIKNPSLPMRLAAQQRPLYLFLLNKWYFDELYDWIFVRPAKWLGRFLWHKGDGAVIDGALNGMAMGIIPFFTKLAGRAQSGYVFTYAFAMVLGIAALLTWTVLGGH